MQNKLNNIIDKYYHLILIPFGFLISLISPLNPFSNMDPGKDSSVFLYIGHAMNEGLIPYRDLFDHKGPLLYLIQYIGIKLAGLAGIWLIQLILMQVNLFLSYKLILRLSNKLAALFSVLCVYLPIITWLNYGNFSEEYSLPFILLAMLLSIEYITTRSNEISTLKVTIIGITLGSVLLLRPNNIPFWITLFMLAVIKSFINRSARMIIKYGIIILSGILIALLPFVLFYNYHNALGDLYDSYWTFNLSFSSYNNLSERVQSFFFFWNKTNLIAGSTIISCIGLILIIKNKNKQINDKIYTFLFSIIFISISMLSVSLSGNRHSHYAVILIPTLLIPVSQLFELISSVLIPRYEYDLKSIKLKYIAICSLVMILINVPYVLSAYDNIKTSIKQPMDSDLQEVIKYIKENSDPQDKILVIGNKCSIYLFSERESASKYFYQGTIGNINEIMGNRIMASIETSNPKIIVKVINQIDPGLFLDKTELYLSNIVKSNEYSINESISSKMIIYEKMR